MKYYVLRFKLTPKGTSGESTGSTYDMDSACARCGTNARLVDPLYVKGLDSVRENMVITHDSDILIADLIYEDMLNRKIKILGATDVVTMENRKLPYTHINPVLSFPKLNANSKGLKISDQCPKCARDGYFNEVIMGNLEKGISTFVAPFEFYYEGIDESFLEQSDIFCTWEHMGTSNRLKDGKKVVRFARPLLICSERVKDMFDELKLKKIEYSQVVITPKLCTKS